MKDLIVWHDVVCTCHDAETATLERLEYTGGELADIRIGEKWDRKAVASCGCGRTTFTLSHMFLFLHYVFNTSFLRAFF